jgi:hypothetical protein
MSEHDRYDQVPIQVVTFRPSPAETQQMHSDFLALLERARELRSPTWEEKLKRAIEAAEDAVRGRWKALDEVRVELLEDVVWCNANARGTVFDDIAREGYEIASRWPLGPGRRRADDETV